MTSLPYIDNNRQFAGSLRLNSTKLEIYDGLGNWLLIPPKTAVLELSPKYRTVMDWACEKMEAEERLLSLSTSNPAVAIAYKKYKDSESQLTTIISLTDDK